VQTCPAVIPIDEIIMSARAQVYQGRRRNIIRRTLSQNFMKRRGLPVVITAPGALAFRTGLMPRLAPPLAAKSFTSTHKGTFAAQGKVRARVAYFIGCATNTFYPDTARDTLAVYAKNGIEVVIPEGLCCCGLPSLAEGDLEVAQQFIRNNINILAAQEVDAIITDCTSCGMALKTKMAKALPDGDPLKLKAELLSSKIFEATDYLNQLGLVEEPGAFPATFTYHVPCHRKWTPTLNDAPRNLLDKIKGAKRIEMEFPERCCGAAGVFFLDERELSRKIQSHKIQDILKTGAEIVITQCPSCRSYINSGLSGRKVMHPLSLLARAYGL
jgi:glycolate oxidase iron-sulfur subunit